MRHRKILSACFGVSLCLHLCALFCFQKYSLWFSAPQTAQSAENWLSLVDKKERDQILKSAFDPMAKENENAAPLKPIHEDEIPFAIKPPANKDLFEQKNAVLFQLSIPYQEPLLTSSILPSFSIPSQSFNLLEHLPKDLIVPTPANPRPQIFLPLPAKTTLGLIANPSPFDEPPSTQILYSNEFDLSLTEKPGVGKAPMPIPLPNLPKLPTLAELETSTYSESFDADLIFLPNDHGKGYIFALTLIPTPDLNLPKLKQNITFLIDRSNAIQQGRLNATKSAVHKALSGLNPEDTFNIIAFDSKMEKMSPYYLPCTGKSFAIAEEFLEKIQLGSFFSSSDLYKSLFLTVPAKAEQNEIHTAILLTDGETLGKKAVQQALFSDWTHYNSGKVTLYAIGMQDLHFAKLDAIAAMNRGKLINAPTHRGMKRKLLKLLKTIQNPIAKNISCHVISKSPNGNIVLFPKSSQMPHLYLDQPYVILGETDTLDDFILFVQGRLKDRWLNIKKKISFLNARKGNPSLKQEWALQRAYHLYEQFVIDADPKHIADAKTLLESFDLPVAF